MKIIFIVSAMNGGGAERVVATLANRYIEYGDDVTILMTAGNASVYPLHQNVKVFSICQPSKGNPLIRIKRLLVMRKFFREHIDSHLISFSTQTNLFSIIAAIGLHLNLIVSERNDPNQYKHKNLRNYIYEWGVKENVRFVFQTEDARRCFSKRIQNKSIVIINPLRRDLPEIYEGIKEKKIAVVGRLEEQKNHKLLLEAYERFHRVFPEYELHIFGEGKLKAILKIRAENLHIMDSVIFEGFCKHVLERIKKYTMFVLSSDYEGIPNSLMEAMAMGIPCISTDCPIGGSALCIDTGVNGLLVPVGNADELANAMKKIAENKDLAERLSKEAVKVRESFDEKRIAEKWRTFIGEKNE